VLADSHCHLEQLPDAGIALAEAASCGVVRVIAVSEDSGSIRAVLALKDRFPGQVVAGLGLHPAWVVQRSTNEVAQALAELEAAVDRAAVIGEIGLDHKWADTALLQSIQEEALAAQLDLAGRRRLPVSLHSRRCPRQVLERAAAFHRRTGLQAHLHWFTHSEKLVRLANEEGIFVSVGPTVLDHPPTQQVALAVADDLLLLESDAPVAVSGVPGTPARVREVAETLARLKGTSVPELAAQTTANLARFLGAS
jgi:TatD DNase family protein